MNPEIAENIKKKRNNLKKEAYIGISILSILLIGVLFVLFAPKIIVQKKIAEIKAKGDPVSMKDLAGPKIPDNQNGAVIYEKIIKMLPKETDSFNTQILIDKYGKEWYKNKSSFIGFRQYISKNNMPFTLLDSASAMPKCRFKHNWEDGPLEVLFTQFRDIRQISRFLQMRALIESHDGKMDDAVKDVGRIFKLSDSLKEEPALIGQLVRYAIISIGRTALTNVEYWGNINEKQARELDSIVSKINLKDSAAIGIKGERAFGIEVYDLILEKGPGALSDSNKSSDGPLPKDTPIISQFIYYDEIYYLDKMQEAVDYMSKPYTKNKKPVEFYESDSMLHMISNILMPVFTKAPLKEQQTQANLLGCRIFLGLQVYRDRFGTYPENLNLLRTKLNWPVEKNPYTNNDFIYNKISRGFLLKSIGPKFGGINNETLIEPGKYKEDSKDNDTYDLVWWVEK